MDGPPGFLEEVLKRDALGVNESVAEQQQMFGLLICSLTRSRTPGGASEASFVMSPVNVTSKFSLAIQRNAQFAYAVAPGLYPDGEDDNLRYNVAKDRANRQAWEDEGPGRFRTYALALRPLLAQALQERSTLESFLPRARDVFLALREVEEATVERAGPPKLAIAGPAGDVVRERLLDSRFHLWISWFNHAEKSYAETLRELGQGDLFVLLVAGDDSERIPKTFAHLSPIAPEELERRLRAGHAVEEERAEPGRCRFVLLAAPTRKALDELARQSSLVHD